MFYDIKQFPFLQEILDNLDSIIEEFEKVKNKELLSDFIHNDYPEINSHILYYAKDQSITLEDIGYDFRNESWGAFPLYKNGFEIKWYNVLQHFPKTSQLISKVPNTYFSAFVKLTKNKGILPHQHHDKNIIFHVCLYNLYGYSELYCGNEKKVLKNKGDWAIFDASVQHHSINFSNTDRINFVVDFQNNTINIEK